MEFERLKIVGWIAATDTSSYYTAWQEFKSIYYINDDKRYFIHFNEHTRQYELYKIYGVTT